MSDTQVEAKFRALTAEALSKDRDEKLLEASWQLEKIADIREVANLMRSDSKGEQMDEVA
jgi:hypothetical protein